MNGLMLHCGGEHLPRHELAAIPSPAETETYKPLPHADFVDMVQDELENFGLRVVSEAHGVVRRKSAVHGEDAIKGGNYFGLLECKGDNFTYNERALVLGLRNSHVKRFPAQIVIGDRVFVCDNMCFSGEINVTRKHTKNLLDDRLGVRPLIVEAISKLLVAAEAQDVRYEAYKAANMSNGEAEVIMIDALRQGVVTSTQLPKVVQQWDTPDHEEFAKHRNGWRMFNAVTEALKGTSPLELPGRTMKLTSIMDRAVSDDDDPIWVAPFEALAA